MNRRDILRTAEELTYGDRNHHYDSPRVNFERIAKGWSVILGTDVTPEAAALCMTWLKISRAIASPTVTDHAIDGAAYFAIFGELSTEKGKAQ